MSAHVVQFKKTGRFFETCATLSCVVQWMWALALLAYPFFSSDIGKFFVPAKPEHLPPAPAPIQLPTVVETSIMLGVVLVAIALSIFAIIWVPREVNRGAKQSSQKAAEALVPIISKHQPLSPRAKRQLTQKTIRWIKTGAIMLPFLLLFLTPFSSESLDIKISIIFGALLLAGTLLWTGLAILCYRLSRQS